MAQKTQKYPEDVQAMIRALKRARKAARKVSQETGTPFIYMKDGKIVKEMIPKP
jgi:hypothetical protein